MLIWQRSENSKANVLWLKYGQYKSKTFDSKIQAMAWAAETEQSLSPDALISGKTLGDCFIRYRDEISPTKKSYRSEYNRLNKFSRHALAELPLSEIKYQTHIYDWIDESLTEIKSSSVNRYLNLLSSVFEQAKCWRWTRENPTRGIKRPKNPRPRDRRISDKEIEKILDVLGFDGETVTTHRHFIAVAFLLAIETALRQGEIWGLEWEDVFLNKSSVAWFNVCLYVGRRWLTILIRVQENALPPTTKEIVAPAMT